MKKTPLFNNVSQELLDSTKLKKGEQVVYKLYGIGPNPSDPSKMGFPSVKNIPPIDQIYDEHTGSFVDIAAIRSVTPNGDCVFHEIYFYGAQSGVMLLNGSKGIDQEIHSYMMLSNYNASNKNRDTSKEPMYELVDENKTSEIERKTRNMKREALNTAADLTPDEVRTYIAALGQDDTRKIDLLRNDLESMADKDPKSFMELVNNKQAIMKAVINRALSKGVITFDAEQAKFGWPTGEAILTVSRTTGGEPVEELVSYCVSNQKGEKVYQTIQSKIKK